MLIKKWLYVGMLLLASMATAAPFARTFTFTQPNGTIIELWGEGDEFSAHFTHDGYTVVFDDVRKAYFYAELNADATAFLATPLQAGIDAPPRARLAPGLRLAPDAVQVQRADRYAIWDAGMQISTRWPEQKELMRRIHNPAGGRQPMAPPRFTTVGTKVGLTLLIDFDSVPATVPQNEIVQFLNGDNYTGYGNNGSVKEYFQDVSKGALTYTNVVTAYIRIPNSLHPRSYYADPSRDAGRQGNLLIRDALDILKAQPNYQTEVLPRLRELTLERGEAVALNVLYTGDDGGVWSRGLWPHSWALNEVGVQNLGDGIRVNRYQITNIGAQLEIATFCHENGHMLCGYPDLYDYATDGTESVGGTGHFCLMAAMGTSGKNPSQVCAYLKSASGWAEVIDVTPGEYLEVELPSSSEPENDNVFYRVVKPATPTEYYLIENRQQVGRDRQLPAGGIAIWHIDELGDRDIESLAYNNNHHNFEQLLMQADNLWHLNALLGAPGGYNYGDANDLWFAGNSAAAYSNMFNDDTQPSARWWDGTPSLIKLEEFSAKAATMTFCFQVVAPTILTSTNLPHAFVGTEYNYRLHVAGGALPLIWSITDGALPSGLTFDTATGRLQGVPEEDGLFSFEATVVGSNDKGDSRTFWLVVKPAFTTPFEQNFDAIAAMPEAWTQEFVAKSVPWHFSSGSGTDYNQPRKAFSAPYNARFAVKKEEDVGATTRLVSPMIDFGEAPLAAALSFTLHMQEWADSRDVLRVYYRTTRTSEWQLLREYKRNIPLWEAQTIPLPESSRTFYVAFEGVANYGHGIHIDNIWLGDPTLPLALDIPAWLPEAHIHEPYSYQFEAIGGVEPYQFTLGAGSELPEGITLDLDGLLSGTASNAVDQAPLVIVLSDSTGTSVTNTLGFTVVPYRAVWFFEDFESHTLLTHGWTQEHLSGNHSWEVQMGGGNANSYNQPTNAHSGLFNVTLYNQNQSGRTTRLISPPINLGVAPTTPTTLTFWYNAPNLQGDQDSLRILWRSEVSAPWQLLAEFDQEVRDWSRVALQLPSPSTTYQIAFEGTVRYGGGISIDDIALYEAAPAPLFVTPTPLPVALLKLDYTCLLTARGGQAPLTFEVNHEASWPGWLLLSPEGELSGTPLTTGLNLLDVAVVGADGARTTMVYPLIVQAGLRLPYSEDFDATTTLPAGWQQTTGTLANWVLRKGSPTGHPASAHSGTQNLCLAYQESEANLKRRIELPMLNLVTGVRDAKLSFWLHMKAWGYDQDRLMIYYKSTPGSEWKPLYSHKANVATWTRIELDLPEPSDTYLLAFEGVANGGYGICIDDVAVAGEVVTTGIEAWRDEVFGDDVFNPAVAADDADPDGDGVPNLWEYIAGTNPLDGSDGQRALLYIATQDSHPVVSFSLGQQAQADGLVWWLEGCQDLLEPQWRIISGSELRREAVGTRDQIFYGVEELVLEASPYFYRLQIVLP